MKRVSFFLARSAMICTYPAQNGGVRVWGRAKKRPEEQLRVFMNAVAAASIAGSPRLLWHDVVLAGGGGKGLDINLSSSLLTVLVALMISSLLATAGL